jgi:5-methylthioadenosine/S-adenosylhomocysteine deaminase
VTVGTDGAASNNNLDLLGELRTAALLAKGVAGDPRALDAVTAIDLVTINAARALGLGDRLGTIEPGKQADFCAIDLEFPETQPLHHHISSQLVYAASARQVTDVWAAGERVLQDGELTRLDLQDILARVRDWNRRMAAH